MVDIPANAKVFIVDDDADLRNSLEWMLRREGLSVHSFPTAQEFLDWYQPVFPGCLLLDVRMPGMTGQELQRELDRRDWRIPVVIMSGHADVPIAVEVVQGGALDVIEKPFERNELLALVRKALVIDARRRHEGKFRTEILARHNRLTPREREVFDLLIQGNTTKEIAWKLEVSARTVEKHRERVLKKMRADSASNLILLAVDGGLVEPSIPVDDE